MYLDESFLSFSYRINIWMLDNVQLLNIAYPENSEVSFTER